MIIPGWLVQFGDIGARPRQDDDNVQGMEKKEREQNYNKSIIKQKYVRHHFAKS